MNLDIDEFHMLLKEFGCVKQEDEISFITFARTMMKGDETCEDEDELLNRVFRLFDLDDSGGITIEEFEVLLQVRRKMEGHNNCCCVREHLSKLRSLFLSGVCVLCFVNKNSFY